jgi:diguanylate cyclase (GGDEF)-like protein
VAQTPGPKRLLLVESDSNDAKLIVRHLEKCGAKVVCETSVADARRRLETEEFHLVLASEALPDGDALDLLPRPGGAPLALLAEEVTEELVDRVYGAGALDLFVKDAHLLKLLPPRVTRLLERVSEKKRLADVLEENRRLAAANRMLAEISMKDPLTGVFNRRGFDEALQREVSRAARAGAELSIAYFDLDSFKSINDDHGHEAGDLVLRHFADVLRREARGLDVIARVGGDEFAALLPAAPLAGALRYAERVRSGFESTSVPFRGRHLSTTVSGGAARFQGGPEFLQIADEYLYRAKAAGRNRVVALMDH